jgi:hypothetical protein
MKKKLPIGKQSFEVMRSEEYVYIDKTEQVLDLINNGTYYFLSRPRRFGKSLLVDTMHCLFEGKRDLFAGLYIKDKRDRDQTFPVIKISFGSGNIVDRKYLKTIIHEFLETQARNENIQLISTTSK